MAKQRKLENLSYYEWYVSRWITSDTHLELDATGRGIYREMLDYCYIQGSISSDPIVLAKRCACTREELRDRWEMLERHFYTAPDGKLRNKFADKFRGEYENYIHKQAAHGKTGGRPPKDPERVPFPDQKGTLSEDKGYPLLDGKGTLSIEKGSSKIRKEEIRKEETIQQQAVDAFETWIAIYPKKVRTQAAAIAWGSLVAASEITLAGLPEVMDGTERWKRSKEWAKENGRFIPDPTTFLVGNAKHPGRMWRDHPEPLEQPQKRSSDGVDPLAEYVLPEEWRDADRGE